MQCADKVSHKVFHTFLSSAVVFQPIMLHLSSDSFRIEKLSGVAAVIVEVKWTDDFADAEHVRPHYSLEGPRVLVISLSLSLLFLHGSQTLSAHHLYGKKNHLLKYSKYNRLLIYQLLHRSNLQKVCTPMKCNNITAWHHVVNSTKNVFHQKKLNIKHYLHGHLINTLLYVKFPDQQLRNN